MTTKRPKISLIRRILMLPVWLFILFLVASGLRGCYFGLTRTIVMTADKEIFFEVPAGWTPFNIDDDSPETYARYQSERKTQNAGVWCWSPESDMGKSILTYDWTSDPQYLSGDITFSELFDREGQEIVVMEERSSDDDRWRVYSAKAKIKDLICVVTYMSFEADTVELPDPYKEFLWILNTFHRTHTVIWLK